jgi:seryl-tRNA synthetase
VTNLASQTQELLAEYRSVVRQIESLRIYNDNLERVVIDQRSEVQSINRQLEGLEETNRGVVPLMLEMIEALNQVVEADIPFRIEERRERVQRLRDMMDQADVTASEKYRRVIEAYQSELEFGRTTEAYSDTLPSTGQTVDFLRVGRALLVYQTSDSSETGWFNPGSREFEELPGRYRLEVKDGLAIAKNEKAPNLVMLPVPGPEVAQ